MNPHGARPKARVEIGGRTFFVRIRPDGSPVNIVERRLSARGADRRKWRTNTYWHHSHLLGGPNTIVRRILAEAGASISV
jgi:hypothetical protein